MSDTQDDGKLVTIGRFYDSTEAHFYRTVLESRGIQAVVMGEFASAIFPPVSLFASASGGSVRLKVRAEDAGAATAILEEEGGGEGAGPARIGVFGGTFDPIHNTHIEIARTAIAESALDLVLFVVAARPPHKQDETYASADERFAMTQVALENEANMEASGIELDREGPSFTADTLIALEGEYPDAEFFLVIGLDSLADLPTWKDPDTILERAHVLVVPRRGEGQEPASLEGCYTVLPFTESELSSTEVRNRIGMGKSIADFVPVAVAQLIEDRGIYGAPL